MKVFEEIEQARERERQQGLADWRKLCRDVAVGNPVARETVERVLQAAGKSREESEALVELHQRRDKAKLLAAQIPALHKRLDELQAQMTRADATRDAALLKHASTIAPLNDAAAEARKALDEADKAQGVLELESPDQDVIDRLSAVRRRISDLLAARNALSPKLAPPARTLNLSTQGATAEAEEESDDRKRVRKEAQEAERQITAAIEQLRAEEKRLIDEVRTS